MLKCLPAALLLALSLTSCSSESDKTVDADVLAHNDFDNLNGWVSDAVTATLTKTKAHSGKFSTSVQPGSDYSYGYGSTLGKLTDRRPEKITVSAWVMLPNDQANARLVVEVKDPGNPTSLLYDATELRTVVKKYNDWQKVEKTITLPTSVTATSSLLVYMWRADSNEPVYLDDMQISLAK